MFESTIETIEDFRIDCKTTATMFLSIVNSGCIFTLLNDPRHDEKQMLFS